MVRTKGILTNEVESKIHTLASALVARNAWATMLGSQFGGSRDLYEALGYRTQLTWKDYFTQYYRQDIAKAIIDRPAKATWQGPLLLLESNIPDESPLEKAWKELDKQLGMKTKFQRIDRLSGIGSFGILVLGLDDVRSREDFQKPVVKGIRKLMYVKPYGESNVQISAYENDVKNPRYGQPLMYTINVANTQNNTTSTTSTSDSPTGTITVHYSRIVHIVDDTLENEVIGIPRLEAVFNRLMDLEKIIGGDAEMFWRNARPGYQGIVDKDFQMTTEMKDSLREQIDEYEHNLRRMLVNEGIKYETLTQAIADPKAHVDVQVQMISAVTGIPKRVLTGTERGELSSNQDTQEWRAWVQGRREDHAEPHIVRPFVDRCIELGILPKPKEEYSVLWSDLYAMSEADLAKIGLDRANALRAYASTPMAETFLPPDAFFEYFLGFNDDQIELVKQMMDEELAQERIDKLFEEPEPVQPGQSATSQLAKKAVGTNGNGKVRFIKKKQ